MNDELREMLIRAMHTEYRKQFDKPMFPPYAEVAVNAVLDQIEIAGYSLVKSDRFARLLNDASSCDLDCICLTSDFDPPS
jgi:hypothetical protein